MSKNNDDAIQPVSEEALRKRLSKRFSKEEIDQMLVEYYNVPVEGLPDLNVINKLAQKTLEAKLLNIRFTLAKGQYEALAGYFEEDGRPGTFLVQKAIEEFIEKVVA